MQIPRARSDAAAEPLPFPLNVAMPFRSDRLAFLTSRALLLLAVMSCNRGSDGAALFELLTPGRTGVTFANTITTSDALNAQTDPYVYNGAGVAVGDIDNDGRPDLFFTGNMVSSRLYLNKGDLKFEDITGTAKVGTTRWATGATMVDINNDGWLDIYVSVSGQAWSKDVARANQLFINNRDRTFTEAAAQYGIADTSFTTQAAFLDYDHDGCLDLFLLNNSPADFGRSAAPMGATDRQGDSPGGHSLLYRNTCKGTFTNVSLQAGIVPVPGYGLGIAVADVNGDAWPDIYVSNDGAPNDRLYINNRNGTFTDRAAQSLKHTSLAGMGVDIADFNNDAWPDILQVDMEPADLAQRKRMSGFASYDGVMAARSRGVRDDYAVNALQLSNGVTPAGDVVFSEVAHMAGVAATNWSWSALFADFDNDGLKDIFIANGYPKAMNDLDYQAAANSAGRSADTRRARQLLKDLYAYEISSYVFQNNGDLTFTDRSAAWGVTKPGFAYGAAYTDLDGDGKLDLVVNNIDSPASIYHNIRPADSAHHYLAVSLVGDSTNTRGVGATLTLIAGGQRQQLYNSPTRGFMSSMDGPLHFGLGRAVRADTLEVLWPNGRRQRLTNLAADRAVVVKAADATPPAGDAPTGAAQTTAGTRAFTRVDASQGLSYAAPPSTLVDYRVQPLLHTMPSRQGPPLAVGDVDGDGLDDLFVGGGNRRPGTLFLQQKDGRFLASPQNQPWQADSVSDDWGALLTDLTGDGRPDLYVSSGGYQLAPGSPALQDRLYINAGSGRFTRAPATALPPMRSSKGAVRTGDFNGDGRPDLFVAGRLTPRNYPEPAPSYLLRNDGDHFTDVTREMAPALATPGGMVTDAAWVDFDGDAKLDLVTVGEWMPIQVWKNDGTRLRDVSASLKLPPLRGWWYSLAVADVDHDGHPDLIVGNLGRNSVWQASPTSPLGIYAAPFTGGRNTEILLTQRAGTTEFPIASLATLSHDIYTLGVKFPTHGTFASASLEQLFSAAQLKGAFHYEVDTFNSVVLHNDGGRAFRVVPLPTMAQMAPIRGIVPFDVDGDGHLDLTVAGNLYDVEPNTPRIDAGNGLWLRGDGRGHFAPVSPRESGLLAPRNVAGLAVLRTAGGHAMAVANTADSLQLFRLR